MGLYLDEPYFAHQKDRIFATEYERVFGRLMYAKKIYLAYVLDAVIESLMPKIEDPSIRTYQLTKFILLGVLGNIFRRDPSGQKLISNPEKFLPENRDAIHDASRIVVGHLVSDFNYYVKGRSEKDYFDYKTEFKNAEKYRTLATQLFHEYERSLVRHPEDSFESVLKSELGKRGKEMPT